MNIKQKIVNELIAADLVKPYYVINHSYTDGGGRDLTKIIISTNGIMPCLTTRPDTMGVVIDEQK